MMVDSTGISPANPAKSSEESQNSASVQEQPSTSKLLEAKSGEKEDREDATADQGKQMEAFVSDKVSGRTRSKSNQRWMKLRTTVQLSGAMASTSQKSKPPLKREDSFLKRFSTRQIPETQETVDTGDETETLNGSQTQNEVNRRRRKRRKEMSKTVVNPDENFFFYWLMTVTVCVLYNLWTLIVRQSFPELQKTASAFWYSGDGFTDVIFVCDIVVQFRTGYLEQGLMVYNSKKLATHYLKSRAFILDLLSLLPLDFIQFNIGVNPILRFPRFLKIYRVYNYYYIVESRTVYPNLWRVVNLIHILLILAHWFGCFYYLLSEAEGFQGDWVYPYRSGDYATLTRKYLGSLYWSTLTLTTIGDLPTPETNAESRGRSKAMTPSGNPEGNPRRAHKSRLLQFNSNYGYLFTIVSYLIGVFIFATIVGQVGNVITNRNANRLEFERLLDGAKTYMRHHKVPGGMKRRVLRWYDYSWSRGRIQGGGDINTALGLLPDKLKTELALHVNLSVLKKVTIFQECQPEFLHDLVLKMKAYIFTPGDLICRKGEVAREMFIIADGILDVISENGRVLTTMKAGDFFGEIGILNLDGLNKRTADVRSVGYSELFSLSREDVLTAMKDYPEAQEILQSLGRKRLMEAKNASKIYRAQVKQAKDHDSSGDSDTAGKRIVEKLRSDVKGLKNVLRRSRKGAKRKETLDFGENIGGKISSKKHSILRRMSHVQSSDEYEANNETTQSPIGAGLPLLQRLKLLKEKQEKDEKERNKVRLHTGNHTARQEDVEAEPTGVPVTQRLKFVRLKDEKGCVPLESAAISSTVRTQVSGVRFGKSISKTKTITISREPERKSVDLMAMVEEGANSSLTKKDSTASGRKSLMEKLKLIRGGSVNDQDLPSSTLEDFSWAHPSSFSDLTSCNSETSNNVSLTDEACNSVPGLLENKFEVPKNKDGWKLLKKSSLSCQKSKQKNEERGKKVSKTVIYLSKSDTVLEKQKTVEREEERCPRSISPSGSENPQKKRLKQVVEELMKEKQKTRALNQVPFQEGGREGSNFWEFPQNSLENVVPEGKENIKKYNSISDLSPEYSGLPFVKKLKILNERQKLAELEKELLVRSASLDVPERPAAKSRRDLVRSQSEASTIESTRNKCGNFESEQEVKWRKVRSSERPPSEIKYSADQMEVSPVTRYLGISEDGPIFGNQSEVIASPESNETLERRHLKSILKKLSAEESTSDEDQTQRAHFSGSTERKSDNSELKKLMRAPTVEGYAARHKKLTKSVTFDNDTLPSPPAEVSLESTFDESNSKDFPPMSPTALLTLQLSNLSMIPIASPKMIEKSENHDSMETEAAFSRVFHEGRKKERKSEKMKKEIESLFRPKSTQDFQATISGMPPFFNSPFHEHLGETIKNNLQEAIQQLLEEVQSECQERLKVLQTEIKKKDEIILRLQFKIQHLEEKDSAPTENNRKKECLDGNTDISETDPDFWKLSLLEGNPFEAVFGMCSPTTESSYVADSPGTSPKSERNMIKSKDDSDTNSPPVNCLVPERNWSKAPFDYLGNVTTRDVKKTESGAKDDSLPIKRKMKVLADNDTKRNFSKQIFRRSYDSTSEEELELVEVPKLFPSNNFQNKSQRTNFKFRNPSVEETLLNSTAKSQVGAKWAGEKRKSPTNRLMDKNKDFFALDIDDNSNSSDVENPHNKDWEVQMLVEEMVKKTPEWEIEDEEWASEKETSASHLKDVRELQDEVNTLKQMMGENDLTRFTNSELDMLETIIEAKDKRICQIAKSHSLEGEDKSNRAKMQTLLCSFGSDKRLKNSDQNKRSSLRQKIGQAFSFDFHDMESRKRNSPELPKHRASCIKRQRTISHHERQSLYGLWHTSSMIRNRVLEDPEEIDKNIMRRPSESKSARSSLPILFSSSLHLKKCWYARTSLPTLSPKDYQWNLVERLTSSLSSSEDIYHGSDLKQSHDSVFEEEPHREPIQLEVQKVSCPSTSGLVKLSDCHPDNGFNSFIKTVGQKVKKVMIGDSNSMRNQVPTISKLCEEQLFLKDAEVASAGDFGDWAGVPGKDEPGSIDGEPSGICNSKDCKSKTDSSAL